MKTMKKTLIASMVSMIACVALFVGTTFAWFTDKVENTDNVISSGNFSVTLLMDKDGSGIEEYQDISDNTTKIFDTTSKWEPGRTEIAYLAVQNTGDFAVLFDCDIVPSAVDGKKNLGDVLECAVLDNLQVGELTASNWDELKAPLTVGENYFLKTSASRTALRDTKVEKGETHYFAIALHMQDAATTDYTDASVSIDLQINATQAQSEDDAFGDMYDKDAQFVIESSQDLKRMLTNPVNGARYIVQADVAYPNNVGINTDEVSGEIAYTIDLNGHTLTLAGNTGYNTKGAALTITVTDSTKKAQGKFIHTGDGYMFAADGENDDGINGNGFLQTSGKGFIDLGTVNN